MRISSLFLVLIVVLAVGCITEETIGDSSLNETNSLGDNGTDNYDPFNGKPWETPQILEECKGDEDYNECLVTSAVEAVNYSVCDLLGNRTNFPPNYKNLSFSYIVDENGNPHPSNYIKRSCYEKVAMIDPTPTIEECSQANDSSYACYMTVAERTGNRTICNDIFGEYPDGCMNKVARAVGKIEWCQNIKDDIQREGCARMTLVGIENKTKEDCELAFNITGRDDTVEKYCEGILD